MPRRLPWDGLSRRTAWQTAGFVLGGVGVAGVGASLVLGLLAKGKNGDANMVCNGQVCSSDDGVMLARQAGQLATSSTIAFISGLVFAGEAGLTMVLLAPKASASPVAWLTLSPQVGVADLGFRVGGGF